MLQFVTYEHLGYFGIQLVN